VATSDDKRLDPFDIGGIRYGMVEAVQLRGEIIEMRNIAMKLDPPDMLAAVTLSHTIGLLAALIQSKWPMEWAALAGKYNERTGRRPAKYGDSALDIQGVVTSIEAMEDQFAVSWNAFKEKPSTDTLIQMSEGALRVRMLLDIAAELLSEREEKTGSEGGEDN
jgi:hypothetical protein